MILQMCCNQVFIDLFNSATFLIPREHIPPLTDEMKTILRTHSFSVSVEDRAHGRKTQAAFPK